jgi:hypothetical protein
MGGRLCRGARFAGIAVAAALACAVVAGCGDDKAAKGADLTTLRCPVTSSGRPAPGSFDTSELVGLSLADARARAAEAGCNVVVAMKDGEGVAVPILVDPKRIYVFTEHGAVTQIEGVGGGI